MLNCREVTERADDYVDGSLSPWQAAKVRLHLLLCKYCREFVGQMRTVRHLVRNHGGAAIDHDAEDRLIAAFREHKRP